MHNTFTTHNPIKLYNKPIKTGTPSSKTRKHYKWDSHNPRHNKPDYLLQQPQCTHDNLEFLHLKRKETTYRKTYLETSPTLPFMEVPFFFLKKREREREGLTRWKNKITTPSTIIRNNHH